MTLGTIWVVGRRATFGETGGLAMAVAWVLAGSSSAGEGTAKDPSVGKSVVLKSLKTDLRVGNRVVPMPGGRFFHTFEIKAVEGDWLWIVDPWMKGWVRREEVLLASSPTGPMPHYVLPDPAGADRRPVFEDAHGYFTRRIERDPGSAEAYYMRGSLASGETALADLNAAIRLDPKFAHAHAARGDAHSEAKDDALAQADWARALELDPGLAVAYYSRLMALAKKEDFPRALADAGALARLCPNFFNARLMRGTLLYEMREGDLGVDDLTAAIRLMPGEEMAEELKTLVYFQRGQAYRRLARPELYDLAIADYTEAIRLAAAQPESLVEKALAAFSINRSIVWESKKDWDRAIADCTEVIKHFPKFASVAYVSRGRYREKAKDVAHALDDYAEAIRLDPDSKFTALAYLNRSQIEADQNDPEGALADCAKAIRLLPDESFGFIGRASILRDLGRYARALADCEQAVEVAPKDPWGHYQRAWILATCPDPKFRAGKSAVGEATRACELTRWANPSCLSVLAAAEAEAGDFDAAIRWQTKALGRVYDDEDKAECRSRIEQYRKKQPHRDVPETPASRRASLGLPESVLAPG